jgi:membrane protein implicated in regulation of membrane protease activity
MRYIVERLGNIVMSFCAGLAAFVFTLIAFLLLQDINQQIAASLTIGTFALLIVWVASEKPNSGLGPYRPAARRRQRRSHVARSEGSS